jgi:hypothetical protein
MNGLPGYDLWKMHQDDEPELPELDSDELESVLSDLTTEIGGKEACELHQALSEQIATLAEAHYMLDQLFEHDITISQLFERHKQWAGRDTWLRTLRNLTAQMSKRFDELESAARWAKYEDEVEQSRRDADEARAA